MEESRCLYRQLPLYSTESVAKDKRKVIYSTRGIDKEELVHQIKGKLTKEKGQRKREENITMVLLILIAESSNTLTLILI